MTADSPDIAASLLPLPGCLHRCGASCRGELPEGAAAEYESSRKSYEALHRAVTAMAEALDKQLPDLAEDAFTRYGFRVLWVRSMFGFNNALGSCGVCTAVLLCTDMHMHMLRTSGCG